MSKTYPSVKIVQKDYTRIDGTRNLFLRLTINRKIRYFPINIYVNPDHFKSGTVSRSDPDYKNKNTLIDHYFIKAKKILFDYRIEDKFITFDKFQRDFDNSSYGSKSFLDFYEGQIEILKDKLELNTIKAYKSQLIKLKEFRKEILFNDIDLNFISTYEGFIIKHKKNNKNTVIKSLTYIKSILNKAVAQGIIKENPMKNYTLGSITGDRQFLSMDELNILEKLLYTNHLKPNKANVLRYFLFCCYTGLRYQDIKKLRFRDIINNEYISLQMIKTKEYVNIPLISKAKDLIHRKGFDNQNVFKVLTGQPTNRYLKEIMKTAGIQKKISFHCARHTFATVSKSLGIPYDVISKILGHTDIKTTKIYTKYELNYLSKEMCKWNNPTTFHPE
ncbi:MAG: site-specific integrase [Bacteroidales bacterium]|nr:site-specific integrase [Bacteroidales bacterium]